MEPEVVMTSCTHPTSAWPHATVDCLSTPPCATCFCYVCDVPIAQCDDCVAHAAADGKKLHWNIVKRRRNALVNTWADIPAFVNLIVSLSVEEAVRRNGRNNDPTDDVDVRFVAHALEQVTINNGVTVKKNPLPVAVPKLEFVNVHTAQKVAPSSPTTPVKPEPH